MDGPKLLTLSKDPALFLKNDFYAYIFTINLWDVILFQVRCYEQGRRRVFKSGPAEEAIECRTHERGLFPLS